MSQFLLVWSILSQAVVQATAPAQHRVQDAVESRGRLAASGKLLVNPEERLVGAPLAPALDIPGSLVVSESTAGAAAAVAVLPRLGVIQPRRGNSFFVMSSGIVGTGAPEPGVDFAPSGVPGDEASLTLVLEVPEGATELSFDYNFLSAEYPDFVGTIFNDTFTAVLTDGDGSRTIGLASVNSSTFFAASESMAGGTGFDIFTEEPEGVDDSFPGGQPDAGLTGYQHVKASVEGGTTITLRFVIRDLGDGILDSAVILDNVSLSFLEVVDPNPFNSGNPSLISSSGRLVVDPELLAVGGRPVRGASCDGVTLLLLRTTLPESGTVRFHLLDGLTPVDGGLGAPGSSAFLDEVTVPTTLTSQGYMACAVYRVPRDFNRGGDEAAPERLLRLGAEFTGPTGDTASSEAPLTLVRPPLVLMHGLWSSAATWTFPLVSDDRFQVTLADYEPTNASFFSTNLLVPYHWSRIALNRHRLDGLAGVQVDYVGHSMGGILARNFAGFPSFYARADNFNQGDLHKLLTLNTPHAGSPVANAILLLQDSLSLETNALLILLAHSLGHPIHLGAIEDLATGSNAIQAIPPTRVPSHALVGTGGSDALTLIPGPLGAFYRVIAFFSDFESPLQGLQHDGIVGRLSQEGGIRSSAQSVFGDLHSIHTFVTSSTSYSSRIAELLDETVVGPRFSEFPAPSALPFLPPEFAPRLKRRMGAGTLTIVSPSNGTVFAAGDTLNVVVDAPVGVERLLVIGRGCAAEGSLLSPTIALATPGDWLGEFQIMAVGVDGSGNVVQSEAVDLTAVAPASLTGVRIVSGDMLLMGVSESRQLIVLGEFSDGVTRDISNPSSGTEYLSSEPQVASVDGLGTVTAYGESVLRHKPFARTTLIARNQGLQDSVTVTVVPAIIKAVPVRLMATRDGRLPLGVGARASIAVLSSSGFDAPSIDVGSVFFGVERVTDRARPIRSSFRDVNRDGRIDALFTFDVDSCGFVSVDTTAWFTAFTRDGDAVEGSVAVEPF